MQSRHNAILHINYGEGTFTIFLTGYGSPDSVKSLLKLSIRGQRGSVGTDPEEIAVNLFWYAKKKTTVHLMQRERDYAFTYHITLGISPTVRIKSNSDDQTLNLFQFVGSARRISEKPPEPKGAVHYGKRKRGRPSGLSQYYVPPPDHITPDGEAVYSHNAKKHKLKINFTGVGKYAPKE